MIVLSVVIPVSFIAGLILVAIACIRRKQENIAKELDKIWKDGLEDEDEIDDIKKQKLKALTSGVRSKYQKDEFEESSMEDDLKKLKKPSSNKIHPGLLKDTPQVPIQPLNPLEQLINLS